MLAQALIEGVPPSSIEVYRANITHGQISQTSIQPQSVGFHIDQQKKKHVESLLYKGIEQAKNEQSYKDQSKRLINLLRKRQKYLGMYKDIQDSTKIKDFLKVLNYCSLLTFRQNENYLNVEQFFKQYENIHGDIDEQMQDFYNKCFLSQVT